MSLFGTIRAFAARGIEISGVRRVVEAVDLLRALPSAPAARWVAPTKLHVTMKFFGEIDAGVAPALRDSLAAISLVARAPRLAFSGFSAFPSRERARVVFAEVEDMGGETAALATSVQSAAEALGFPPETRAFHPHLTVARTAEPVDTLAWLAGAASWRVVALCPELVLYRSDTSRPGAEYEALGRFALLPRKSKKGG